MIHDLSDISRTMDVDIKNYTLSRVDVKYARGTHILSKIFGIIFAGYSSFK